MSNPAIQQQTAKFNKGGIAEIVEVKKFNKGGSAEVDDDDESADLLNDDFSGAVPQYIPESQRMNLMLRPLTASLLQAQRAPGQSDASAAAAALGRGLEGQQDAALELTKYDAAVQAAKEKAKGKTADPVSTTILTTGAQLGAGDPDDEFYATYEDGKLAAAPKQIYDASEEAGKIRKAFADRKISRTDSALRDLENYIATLARQGEGGDLPGVGFFGGRNPFTSTKGRLLRSKLAAFQNVVLKERSGAAVTESELNRIVNELAGGETTKNEKALLIALANARNALEREKLEVINSFSGNKALDKYLREEGISIYDSPTFIQGVAKTEGAFQPVEGRNILEVDGKKITFIGGVRYVYDPKRGKYYPQKDKKKKNKKE